MKLMPPPLPAQPGRVIDSDGRLWVFCYMPQVGGYCAPCALTRVGSCWEVFVWHDGQFGTACFGDATAPEPEQFHLCMSEQFRRFADAMDQLPEES